MTVWKWGLLLLAVFCLSQTLMAATHYVYCGASGAANGNDFTNAFKDLPVNLVRGDTYVVAGSATCTNPGTHYFQDAESGTTIITIRKASSIRDSGVAGFQAAFATNQAVWTAGPNATWVISTDAGFYTFEGNPDAGTGEASTNCGSTCGFALRTSQIQVAGMLLIGRGSTGDCTHVTVRHVEFDNTGAVIGTDATNAVSTNVCDASNLVMDHNYIHDLGGSPFHILNSSNVNLRFNYVARDASNSSNHGDAISCTHLTGMTVAYNIWVDMTGTGGVVCVAGTGVTSSIDIYGNIWWQQNPSTFALGNGIASCEDSQICTFNVFNNTIYNFTVGASRVDLSGAGSGSSATIHDNLWFNSAQVNPTTCAGCTVTTDYNCYESVTDASSPAENHPCKGTTNFFVNVGAGDFHLASETPSNGLSTHSLLAANDFDPDGLSRATTDAGIWSRGAFQFVPSAGAPPAAPTNLTVVVH